jgi:hypothetical protein
LRRTFILGLLAVALLALPAQAAATIYTVNTTADHALDVCAAPPAGDCTIRDALNSIDGPGDSASVPPGDYQLTQGSLLMNNGSLDGAGAGATIIRAAPGDRVFVNSSVNSTSISGVTIIGGDATTQSPAQGGGILVPAGGSLELSDSAVSGNAAVEGGGIFVDGQLDVENTTISGNDAGSGGGLYVFNSGVASLTNSTLAQNQASNGGAIFNGDELTLSSVTIAANTSTGSALFAPATSTPVELHNTIVASDSGNACDGDPAAISGDHNLADDSSCGPVLAIANPLLGPLASNGGPTATLALGALSPAINAGADCPATDQRGATRAGACDVGAYEFGLPRLTVVTSVVNDSGGTRTPADFAVRVLRGGATVAAAPRPAPRPGVRTRSPVGATRSRARSPATRSRTAARARRPAR